ncbi:MAG: ATP-binding protein [Bacteroidales bacterium]|jgi:nitrogen fixation/metabolism regulation signal transduction histidine kinase|nr:ATP-binding protein [Bacteroidales bacterium]
MKLRGLFWVLALMLCGVCVAVFFLLPATAHKDMYIIEAALLVILLYLIFFFRRAIRPYRIISNGMDLLKAQDFASRLRKVGQPEADNMVNIFNTMMDQLKNERLNVREQNKFLDLLVDASPMGVIITDFDGHITQYNKSAAEFIMPVSAQQHQVTDAQPVGTKIISANYNINGRTLGELEFPLAKMLWQMPIDETDIFRFGSTKVYKCSKLSFYDHGFKHPFYLIESLTKEVLEAEKAAYGKVIRVISHEVNNTVAGVTSTLDTVKSSLSDGSDAHGAAVQNGVADALQACTDRCMSMSNFITRFADVVKIPQPILQPADLNKVIENERLLLENMCGSRGVKLSFNIDRNKFNVMLDIPMFEQVLTNVVKNSVESIKEGSAGGGASAADAGTVAIKTDASLKLLEISDNGAGISKDIEQKLFTPFYSTKPNGQGIGLMTISEILTRHHFDFSLRTYPDGITRFRINF